MVQPPTAFVSYSWDDDAHKVWVRDLATRLRGDGVDVQLDQWETVPGDQLPAFMERAIRKKLRGPQGGNHRQAIHIKELGQ